MTASPLGLTLALSLALNPLAALACTEAVPPSFDEGSSISVGRMADRDWSVAVIDGKPLPDGANIWLTVTFDSKVTGHTGCNQFSGKADLDAGMMIFGPLMSTEMACADPAMMEREAAFMKALAEVEWFLVTPQGYLYLQRKDGSTAVCLR
jgi:heat shock protein HslJ